MNPAPPSRLRLWLKYLGTCIALAVVYTSCAVRSGSQAPRKYDAFDASTRCQDYVKRSLKAPSTAKFAPQNELTITGTTHGAWRVTGWVDAQNSFGAQLRNNFVCEIFFSGDQVHLLNLQIDP